MQPTVIISGAFALNPFPSYIRNSSDINSTASLHPPLVLTRGAPFLRCSPFDLLARAYIVSALLLSSSLSCSFPAKKSTSYLRIKHYTSWAFPFLCAKSSDAVDIAKYDSANPIHGNHKSAGKWEKQAWQKVVDDVVAGKALVFPEGGGGKTPGVTGVIGGRSSGDREALSPEAVEAVGERLRVVHDLSFSAGGTEVDGQQSVNPSACFKDIPEREMATVMRSFW